MREQPTEAQIKEFWEWCGWQDYYPLGSRNGWADPAGNFSPDLPPTDINNLFEYAVPKVLGKLGKYETVVLVNNAVCEAIEAEGEIAIALFWALWQVSKLSLHTE